MASPTLREITGMSPNPSAISDSALILIDCQQTYREGVMQLTGVEPALKEAADLLARFRAAGRPVIHIMHEAGPGTPYDTAAPIGQIADVVAPKPGEVVITKTYPSSFEKTALKEELDKLGVKNLVLTGFMTHVCVNRRRGRPSTTDMPTQWWRMRRRRGRWRTPPVARCLRRCCTTPA